MTAVYLYTELKMAECKQRGPNFQHWNTPAHCTAAEGLNQHPALTDADIYKHSVEYKVVKGYSKFFFGLH